MESGSLNRIQLTNIIDKEIVYQRCLLVKGTCHEYSPESKEGDFIAVKAKDDVRQSPGEPCQQNWPVSRGRFRCLVMLQPGVNTVDFRMHHQGRVVTSAQITVNYQPLLQLPPLHLAIMLAKDSPQLIDCPVAKRGAISTAHSDLDAAIAKLRMTAYMWQALTAENMREMGLGRRSFRLDEEWSRDTTTMASSYLHTGSNHAAMSSVAKVHEVRSDKTVAELRNADLAQQNHRARERDGLYKIFSRALAQYGHPFMGTSRPVVAGLILDSHYSAEQNLVLAHAAVGRPSATIYTGLSLGILGSHTTYAWPRFLEEVPACLLDLTPTDDTVANDDGYCATMRGACFMGQGALLREVGSAFGAEDSPGIMARGYAKSWDRVFVEHSNDGDDSGGGLGDNTEPKWDLHDGLRFILSEHFRLPRDQIFTKSEQLSPVMLRAMMGKDDELLLEASCRTGLARVRFTDDKGAVAWDVDFCRKTAAELLSESRNSRYGTAATATGTTIKSGPTIFHLTERELEERFDRSRKWGVQALSMNSLEQRSSNLWTLLADQPFIRVPGTSLVLSKRSIKSRQLAPDTVGRTRPVEPYWKWALLLKRKHEGSENRLTYAHRIDIRIGGTMDGVVVYYADGTKCNCGVASQDQFGGHQSEAKTLTEDEVFDIRKVTINRGGGWSSLDGCQSK